MPAIKLPLLVLFLLTSPVWALTCPTGFIEISDTLVGGIGGRPFAGSLTATLTYNTTIAGLTVRGIQQPIVVTNGVIDVCLVPGFYTVDQTSAGSAISSAWVVPTSGGPYKLIDIPAGTVDTTASTATAATGINFASLRVGATIYINNVIAHVATLPSVTQLTTKETLGTQTGVAFNAGPIEQIISRNSILTIYGPQGPPGPAAAAPLNQVLIGSGPSITSSSNSTCDTNGNCNFAGNINLLNSGAQGYSHFGTTPVSSVTTPGDDKFWFSSTATAPSLRNRAVRVDNEFAGTTTNGSRVAGILSAASTSTTATGNLTDDLVGGLVGINGEYTVLGTGTIAKATAVRGEISNGGSDVFTVIDGANFRSSILPIGAGQTYTAFASFRGSGLGRVLGTVTRSFGLRLDPMRATVYGTGSGSSGASSITVTSITGTILVGMRADGFGVTPDTLVTSVSGGTIGVSPATNDTVSGLIRFYNDGCVGRVGDWSICANDPAYLSADFTASSFTSPAIIGLNSTTPTWSLTTSGTGTSSFMDFTSVIPDGPARIALHPNGIGSLSAIVLANASGSTDYGDLSLNVNGASANINVTQTGTAGTPITLLNIGAGSGSTSLSSICLRFNGTCAATLTPTMMTSPNFTASSLGSGLAKLTSGVMGLAAAGTDYAVATNGTSGQALVSNGAGGFGTPLTLATPKLTFSIGAPGGAALTTSSVSPTLPIPSACTIGAPAGSKYTIALGAGDSGTVTVKFWKIASGTAIPTVANVINTSGLSLATGTQVQSSTFSDFTTLAVAANDSMIMAITAISGTISSVLAVLPCQ